MADDLPIWNLVRETREWVGPIVVTVDGLPTTSFEVSLTQGAARPATWTAPYELESMFGILVGSTTWPLPALGTYTVWARVTDVPEIPVERIGKLKVT